jgi:iron transport multicopper oxidase
VTITANETLTVTSLSSSSSEFVPGKPSPALPATLASGETLELPVTFSPTGTGPLGATLTASTSSGKTATFSLSGTGRAAGPRLEASPPLVTFGATSVGESVSAGATFRNVGGAPLTIEGVRLPSAPFSATGPPAVGETIEPGASVTVTVTFDPTSVGEFNDQIDLDTSGGDEAVGLSGSAGLPGALRIEGEANEFGEVALGTTAKRTFTVTNTGGTAVTIEKSKPPSGGEFAATTTLAEGTTIAPGESLTEQVVFAPTALGPASAVWPINGNDPTGLREVRFSGVGVEASSEAPLSSPETPPVTPPETPHLVAGLGGTGMPGEVGLLAAHETKAPAGIPDVRLLASKLRASASGVVAVALSCPASVSGCTGTIALRLVELVRGRSGTDRTVLLTLASGRFSVAGGTSKTVRLRLSPAARRALARNRTLPVRVILSARDPAGAAHTAYATAVISAGQSKSATE